MEQSNKHFIMGFMYILTGNEKYLQIPNHSHSGMREFRLGTVSGVIVWALSLAIIFILTVKILLALG